MAHIKVVRRSMRPEEWTDLRFGWLKRYIYNEKHEIKNLPEGWRKLCKGDMYFTPDGTAFFKADVTVPEELRGKELWFSLKTAAEIIVKVNGRYVGGVDPNRDRILLTPYISSDELHFEMEGYNRSKPDDERNPESLSVRGCRQIFEGAYLATINHTVLDLVYDLELLLDVAKSELFNEDYRSFLNREINNALNLIDFDDLKNEDVARAKKYLDDGIKYTVTGLPVRKGFDPSALDRATAKKQLGLDPDSLCVFSWGGSLGAGAINDSAAVLSCDISCAAVLLSPRSRKNPSAP